MQITTLPSRTSLLAGLDTVKTVGTSNAQYMKMDKTGVFVYGSDGVEVEENSEWLVNPAVLSGFIAWQNNELVGEEMGMVGAGAPVVKAQLDPSLPWTEQLGFQLLCVSGEDTGVAAEFKTSSKGGLKAVSALVAAIKARVRAGETAYLPVVTLKSDHYKHKQYGKLFTPLLEVVAWSDGEEYSDLLDGAPEGETAPEVEPVPEVEAVQEEEKPKRSRRRA